MRVLFDGRCLPPDGGAGIAHAAEGLWRALVTVPNSHELVLYTSAQTQVARNLPGRVVVGSPNRRGLMQAIRDTRAELLFAPTGSVPFGTRIPWISWVHDTAIFDHPEWFPQSWLRRQFTTQQFLWTQRHAARVLCISETTRHALAGILPKTATGLLVQGIDTPPTTTPWHVRPLSIVAVGSVEPRKQLDVALRAFVSAKLAQQGYTYTIIGRESWNVSREITELLHAPGIEWIRDATDDVRARYLDNARVVLVPSLYEGFGRSALEALAHGARVIVSDIEAHREFLGDAVTYIAPLDHAGWSKALVEVLSQDADQAEQFQAHGRAQVALYPWSLTAKHLLAEFDAF